MCCFIALGAWGKETEVFDNQNLITVQDDRSAKQCQAVRIAPKWYLTAAHCVRPYCDKKCDVIVDLLQGDLYASAIVRHDSNSNRPHVFVPWDYHLGRGKSIRRDLALIFFEPSEEDYFFGWASAKQRLNREEFLKLLKTSAYKDQAELWNFLSTTRATLWTIPNASDMRILKSIAVPNLSTGQAAIGNGFYYFGKLGHYIGPNMGVEKGMSGSAVVAEGGGLIGVVSATLNTQTVQWYNDKDEPAGELKGSYFLFTPLTQTNAAFIQATLKPTCKGEDCPYILPIDSSVAEKTTEKLTEVFGEFKSADEILSVKENK